MQESQRNYGILAILAFAVLLRIVLVLKGGQCYWPDEARYIVGSKLAAACLFQNDFTGAFAALHSADHFLFRIIAVVPAAIQYLLNCDDRLPALILSQCSVLSIWICYLLALSLTGEQRIALITAFILTCSSSLFYYSRHLLPYDMALMFALLSLHFAVRSPYTRRNSLCCGILSLSAFLTYNGYWTLAALSLLTHAVYPRPTFKLAASRLTLASVPFALGLGTLIAADVVGLSILGSNRSSLLKQFIKFSQSVTQGDFREGWRLPFEYLWHAEHSLLIIFGLSFLMVVSRLFGPAGDATEHGPHRRNGLILLVCLAVATYGILAGFSVFLGKFVVYGRLVRQLIPMFAILSAFTLSELLKSKRHHNVAKLAMLLIFVNALWNFRVPLTQWFPQDFVNHSRFLEYDHPERSYRVINAGFIYPLPVRTQHESSGVMVLRATHPLEFLPYQYEGYTPDQRRILRNSDLNMTILDITEYRD